MPSYSVSPLKSCPPALVHFDIAQNNYNIKWFFKPNMYDPQHHTTYTYQDTGIYHPRLEVENPATGCKAEVEFDVQIVPNPTAIAVASPTSIGAGQGPVHFGEVSKIHDSIQHISDWLWDFDDGDTSIQQQPHHVYDYAGNYHPTLTITTNIGCNDSDTLDIVVTGIEELEKHGIKLYPIPASEKITIEAENHLPESIHIFDAAGKMLKRIQLKQNTQRQQIDIQSLSPGIYLLKIHTQEDNILNVKLIKN
jgi:hypothetical protein